MRTVYIPLAETLKSLSNEIALKILGYVRLHGELCVCEFEGLLDLPQPTISRHLKLLTDSGLLTVRRDGRWRFFSLCELPGYVEEIIELAIEEYDIKKKDHFKRCGGAE